MDNAKKYGVEQSIEGIVKPIEVFKIEEKQYDLIMAISALEHIDSDLSFCRKLDEICRGIRKNGMPDGRL